MADVTFDLRANRMEVHQNGTEPWRVTLVDTGDRTMTGGRLRRVRPYLGGEAFCLTYGDGVGDVDINQLLEFHRAQRVLVTLTAVQPPGRFGAFNIAEDQTHITAFREKPKGDDAWINGGFFVVEPNAIDYIEGDATIWEMEPLRCLARDGQLAAYRHPGFWQSLDTLRDKMILEEICQSGKIPWLAENHAEH
jgi:glucose-1-phosphate cytidylyltransferase